MFQVTHNWWSVSYLKHTCVAILRTSLSHFFISSFVVKFLGWGGKIVLWAPHMSGICLIYGSTFCAWLGHFVRPIIKILVNDADFMLGYCNWQCFDHGPMYLNRFMVLTDLIYKWHVAVTKLLHSATGCYTPDNNSAMCISKPPSLRRLFSF